MPDPFEDNLKTSLQRMRNEDAIQTPAFEDVIGRSNSRRNVVPRFSLAFVSLAVLLVAGAFVLAAATSMRNQPLSQHQQSGTTTSVDIDFEQMFSAIDTHFTRPDPMRWTAPTDALLTFNPEDSIDDSFLQ